MYTHRETLVYLMMINLYKVFFCKNDMTASYNCMLIIGSSPKLFTSIEGAMTYTV